ncbi:hypothetical protein BRM23_18495, partial [Xanthomonas oryzae pv. oryzae]
HARTFFHALMQQVLDLAGRNVGKPQLQVPVCGLFAIRMGQGGSNYFPVLFKTHFQCPIQHSSPARPEGLPIVAQRYDYL